MKKLLACFAVLFLSTFSTLAFAEVSYSMPALEVGFKWNSMDLNNATSTKQVVGLQVGGSVVINFATQFGLRTGLFYSERPFKSDFNGTEASGKITYADIPVHFMFKLEDYAGIYLGPSISTKIGDESTVGSITGVKSMITPITFGAQFKFAPNYGLNIFFETVSSNLANNISASRGIGANFVLAFE
jgi:hypothetical protein